MNGKATIRFSLRDARSFSKASLRSARCETLGTRETRELRDRNGNDIVGLTRVAGTNAIKRARIIVGSTATSYRGTFGKSIDQSDSRRS